MCIQSSAREAARVVLLARASVEVCLVVRERRHTRRPTHSAHWPARQAPCSLSDSTRPSRLNSLQSRASHSTGTNAQTNRSTTNRQRTTKDEICNPTNARFNPILPFQVISNNMTKILFVILNKNFGKKNGNLLINGVLDKCF